MSNLFEGFTYDKETGFIKKFGKPVGWKCKDGYVRVWTRERAYTVHRLGWFLTYGAWPKDQIDHINGDRADNRLNNLRESDQRQNSWNRLSRPKSSSPFKGVAVSSGGRGFVARNGQIYLGHFSSEFEAAMVYNISAGQTQGPFANFNQVFEDYVLNPFDNRV